MTVRHNSALSRYELDTDVNNVSRTDELNPIVAEFVALPRRRDTNNWAPRIGFNWSTRDARTSIRGGYGIYYDRVTLQIQSLERGLDGRALPIEVRAGNLLFIDQATGQVPPFAPLTLPRPLRKLLPSLPRNADPSSCSGQTALPARKEKPPRKNITPKRAASPASINPRSRFTFRSLTWRPAPPSS